VRGEITGEWRKLLICTLNFDYHNDKSKQDRIKDIIAQMVGVWIIYLGVSLALAVLHKYCTSFGMAVECM
jgi:hypothetical protein